MAAFSNLYKKLLRKPKLKASDGYFMAKREMQDALARRVEILMEKRANIKGGFTHDQWIDLTARIQALEEARSFVRNNMLWDTSL